LDFRATRLVAEHGTRAIERDRARVVVRVVMFASCGPLRGSSCDDPHDGAPVAGAHFQLGGGRARAVCRGIEHRDRRPDVVQLAGTRQPSAMIGVT
jgi:hypothetical protein